MDILGLELVFIVVSKCLPRVVTFRGLQLVRQLCSIQLAHSLHQNWVLLILGRTTFPFSWSEWTTGLRLVLTSVVVVKRFWNCLFLLVSWWLDNLPAYSRCCGSIVCACAHNWFSKKISYPFVCWWNFQMWFQERTCHGWIHPSWWFPCAHWCWIGGLFLTGLSPSLVYRERDLGGLGCTKLSQLPLLDWYQLLLRVCPMMTSGYLSRVDGAN